MLWSGLSSRTNGHSMRNLRLVNSFSAAMTLPHASTIPVNIVQLFAADEVYVPVKLLAFHAIQSQEVHDAGIVVDTVRTITLAEFIFSIPVDVFVGSFKN